MPTAILSVRTKNKLVEFAKSLAESAGLLTPKLLLFKKIGSSRSNKSNEADSHLAEWLSA